jgi:hypothetical protein
VLSKARAPRLVTKKRTGIGVVCEVSIKDARVSSEAPIKSEDQVMVTLQLPKQIEPLAVERATVRWAKNQTFGLEFMHLTFTGVLQLKNVSHPTPGPSSSKLQKNYCGTMDIQWSARLGHLAG